MLPCHLGLVSLTSAVSFVDVAPVSAAIQKQLARDFNPLWSVDATIDPFPTLADVPSDYWKIMIVDTFKRGGQHKVRHQQPYALVAAGASWSLAASHEALEMLADPSGNRTIAAPSPVDGQGRVDFLVEVCDPCQGDEFAYAVNGILVSDFYTPNYFDPVTSPSVRYSFCGAIRQPRQVLPGGYLSWREPSSGDWYQQNRFGPELAVKNFGPIEPDGTLRSMMDAHAGEPHELSSLMTNRPSMQRIARIRASVDAASAAHAQNFNDVLRHRGVKADAMR